MILHILSKMLPRDQSNSLELVELVQIFSTIYILEGVDKDKAVGKKSLLFSLLIEISMIFSCKAQLNKCTFLYVCLSVCGQT